MSIIEDLIEINIDKHLQNDPKLKKRFMQNIYNTYNHIDYKRQAIDGYIK